MPRSQEKRIAISEELKKMDERIKEFSKNKLEDTQPLKLDENTLEGEILKDEYKKAVLTLYMGLPPSMREIVGVGLINEHFNLYTKQPYNYEKRLALSLLKVQLKNKEWNSKESSKVRQKLYKKAEEIIQLFKNNLPITIKSYEIYPQNYTEESLTTDEFEDFIAYTKARKTKKGLIKSSFTAKFEIYGKNGMSLFVGGSLSSPDTVEISQKTTSAFLKIKEIVKQFSHPLLSKEYQPFVKEIDRALKKMIKPPMQIDLTIAINYAGREVYITTYGNSMLFALNHSIRPLKIEKNEAIPYNQKTITNRIRNLDGMLYICPSITSFSIKYKDWKKNLKYIISKGKKQPKNKRDYSVAAMWFI